jgi:hypothetical protein
VVRWQRLNALAAAPVDPRSLRRRDVGTLAAFTAAMNCHSISSALPHRFLLLVAVLLGLVTAACDTGDEPSQADAGFSCPTEARPTHGAACSAPADVQCEGSDEVLTCDERYGGQRLCTCVDGAWDCPNPFCAEGCPATLEDALIPGTPCGDGACYYEDGFCPCGPEGFDPECASE